MNKHVTQLQNKFSDKFQISKDFIKKHPYVSCVLLLFLYLLIFQHTFILSGDTWAEAYSEFLNRVNRQGIEAVYSSSWEGYIMFLPAFFAKLYVGMNWSIGYIDYYFRFITVTSTVLIVSFVAAAINRRIIKSDAVRILLALVLLMQLYHVSIFSFINMWYIGFLPIIIIALNPTKLNKWQQVLYVVYSLAMAFTKPSIMIAPFLVYRAYKTKEYVSNGIIVLATIWQTYLLFYATSNGARTVSLGITDFIKALYYGGSIGILKLLEIPPNAVLIFLLNLIIIGLFILIFVERRILFGLVMLCGYFFAIYTNLLAPNAGTIFNPQTIYAYDLKLQRWLLLNIFLALLLFLPMEKMYKFVIKKQELLKWPMIMLGVGLLLVLYRPIDTTAASLYADISPFRHGLSVGQPTCLPIAPMPTWSPGTNWYYQSKGGCTFINFEKTINKESFTQSLSTSVPISITGSEKGSLMTVVVVVKSDDIPARLYLRDTQTGLTHVSSIKPNTVDDLRFVSFNLSGYPDTTEYSFELVSDNSNVKLGTFNNSNLPTIYAYYMGTPIN